MCRGCGREGIRRRKIGLANDLQNDTTLPVKTFEGSGTSSKPDLYGLDSEYCFGLRD